MTNDSDGRTLFVVPMAPNCQPPLPGALEGGLMSTGERGGVHLPHPNRRFT